LNLSCSSNWECQGEWSKADVPLVEAIWELILFAVLAICEVTGNAGWEHFHFRAPLAVASSVLTLSYLLFMVDQWFIVSTCVISHVWPMKRRREFAYYTLDMCRVSLERGAKRSSAMFEDNKWSGNGQEWRDQYARYITHSSIRTRLIIVLFTNSNSINTAEFLENWYQLIFKKSTRGTSLRINKPKA
jgi:hypothetical protein